MASLRFIQKRVHLARKICVQNIGKLPNFPCDLCQKTFHDFETLEVHIKFHKGHKDHVCLLCGEAFLLHCNLQTHLRGHFIGQHPPYKCMICAKEFSKWRALLGHTKECCQPGTLYSAVPESNLENKVHAGGMQENTEDCRSYVLAEISLNSINRAPKSIAEARGEGRKYDHYSKIAECDICGLKLKEKNLVYHRKIHTGDLLQCKTCFKYLTYPAEVAAHERRHRAESNVHCGTCNRVFKGAYALKKHSVIHMKNRQLFPCRICSKRFLSKSAVKVHLRTHRENEHECPICNMKYSTILYLKVHIQTHSSEKPYLCDLCGRSFGYRKHLVTHTRYHLGTEKRYKCNVCEKKFTLPSLLRLHLNTHEKTRPYRCQICQKAFTSLSGLKNHRARHIGIKNYKCNMCGKAFVQNGDLRKHVRSVHEKYKPHQCPICHRFLAKGLKEHIRRHTGESSRFTCDICSKSLSSKYAVDTHMRRVHRLEGEKKIKCDMCEQRFWDQYGLKKHMQVHTGEKPHKCDICSKNFSTGQSLMQHMRMHTGERPYSCSICEKKFRRTHHLKSHLLTHTQHKDYKCHICGKALGYVNSLKRHLLVHAGIKNFFCSVCDRSFTDSKDLSVHMITHTEERAFKCEICSESFRYKRSLKNHLKLHAQPIRCDICNEYVAVAVFNRHMKQHQNAHVNKYECPYCPLRYKFSQSRDSHVKKVHMHENR